MNYFSIMISNNNLTELKLFDAFKINQISLFTTSIYPRSFTIFVNKSNAASISGSFRHVVDDDGSDCRREFALDGFLTQNREDFWRENQARWSLHIMHIMPTKDAAEQYSYALALA